MIRCLVWHGQYIVEQKYIAQQSRDTKWEIYRRIERKHARGIIISNYEYEWSYVSSDLQTKRHFTFSIPDRNFFTDRVEDNIQYCRY